ncbi:acetyl-CoA C-acyltransferase [Roseovarius sp. ZX-A-9]|uniref:acetyl-CoA C-acyltransferase n=1 Tax=Roseovarius sp. ZX-A-9 TaxID=3014783 RepID=UPI00232EB2C8|nr:acetyl-CoA C-acyltransferase [Roseovarius sp. ZX-A-9]
MSPTTLNDAYLCDGLRTPFGRYGGSLSALRPDDMAGNLIAALIARMGLSAERVEEVILGCSNQGGEDSRNLARNAALLAGLPDTIPARTVNRLCASGLAAILDARRMIACGEADLLIAGGAESMSRAPIVTAKPTRAFDRTVQSYDSTLGWRFPNAALLERIGDDSLSETAENVAKEYGISREASDRFAHRSQQAYAQALARGFFDDEITPTTVPGRKPVIVPADEHPRPDTGLDKLAALRPLGADGVVTAGNASGINDGACVVALASAAYCERAGVKPLARIISSAAVGVPARVMGLGPVTAIQTALARAGLTLADMDVIEINEAFAAQVLGCLKGLKIDSDDPRVNPNGGAIALGHPLGASGARLALTAARSLRETGKRYAVVSLCVGIGQGEAAVIETL